MNTSEVPTCVSASSASGARGCGGGRRGSGSYVWVKVLLEVSRIFTVTFAA